MLSVATEADVSHLSYSIKGCGCRFSTSGLQLDGEPRLHCGWGLEGGDGGPPNPKSPPEVRMVSMSH